MQNYFGPSANSDSRVPLMVLLTSTCSVGRWVPRWDDPCPIHVCIPHAAMLAILKEVAMVNITCVGHVFRVKFCNPSVVGGVCVFRACKKGIQVLLHCG
mmetsp:Transcript_40693/g.73338  ORF Transcript_40693/g.73338 Transcript_40693/m.73338 type:complete len:99 (+) Transcript_40693:279-575(+)